MFGKSLLAAAIVAALPVCASAENYDWSGFYAGAHAGWSRGNVDWVDNNGGWFTFAPGTTHSATDDGFIGGVQIGALRQWDKVVGGVELSLSGLSNTTAATSPLFPASDVWNTGISALATATARLGVASGRFLPYVEAGYAAGKVDLKNVDSVFCGGPATPCVFDSSKWHHGYVVGGGVDVRVKKNMMIGVNYRYANLGSITHAGTTTILAVPESYSVDASVHAVTVRLNWLFNAN
jgi:outer membrane immunogenic protein